MANIFLSYSRDDLASARPLALALGECGHAVWWDRHIKGGAQYSKEIDRALNAADVVLVLWSATSIESAWVRDEAETGRDSGRLVPATLDDSRPPLGFRQYQAIDLRDWKQTSDPADLDELHDALSAVLGSENGGAVSAPRQSGRKRSLLASRRKVLLGAGAGAAVALGGGAFLYRRNRVAISPEVESLMVQAKQLMDQATPAGQYQAIGLYQRVVKLMPDYADGWGSLGVSYAIASHYRERAESITLRAKAQSAGRRALELDPDNVYGELALAAALPFVGYWRERDFRLSSAIARNPRNDDLLTIHGVSLQFDGRPTKAISSYQQVSKRPFTPAVYTNYLLALWSAGRLAELDQAMEDAASLYPTQLSLWYTRFNILSYERRADAAIAMAENMEGRPPDLREDILNVLVMRARAISSRIPAQIEAVMRAQLALARKSAIAAEAAIKNASAMGRLDQAFDLAAAYYFGRGFVIPDFDTKGSTFSPEQRQTRFLFEPVTKPMRADPRFEPLVAELGLDRFWREADVQPDYRIA